jgi:hypothetical protein
VLLHGSCITIKHCQLVRALAEDDRFGADDAAMAASGARAVRQTVALALS